MAVRTFYGTCKTASGERDKQVYVPDTDLTDEFNFKEGDLLVVFFAQTNTESNPRIVVYNQDPELEISTTNDSGKFIKSIDVEADMEDAWAAGETVIFAYTQLSTENTYYWELIDAFHASIDTYGNTKLFDDSDFANWITEPIDTEGEDSKIALTPNTLKKLFDLLGLVWEPEEEGGQTLGTLSLNNGKEGVTITYPLETKIAEYLAEHHNITHTGQLINNGNGNGEGHETEESEPFITRIIPENLYFNDGNGLYYGIDPNAAQPRINLNDAADKLVLGDTSDQTLMGITINKPTEIFGNTKANGQLIAIPETPGQVTNAVGITTNGVIQEKNVNLSERYGPLYEVEMIRHYTGTIESNKSTTHLHPSVLTTKHPSSGWTAVGIVGFNVNYYKDAGAKSDDAYYANVWECYLKDATQIEYAIFNFRNAAIKVFTDIYVLYKKKI